MTVATLARNARESLALGLEALQSRDAPPELLNVARPLAAAMGVLMDLEQAQSVAHDGADPALDALREALRLLQCPEYSHYPASDDGMTAVARALGFVHKLATELEPEPVSIGLQALPVLDVTLGPHTASNFYQGLSAAEVIAGGGLFVATYTIPCSGSRLRLRVLLPGNLGFTCEVQVTWIRAATSSSENESSSPGFGARLMAPSQEAQELVRRFVRNREPILYDDL